MRLQKYIAQSGAASRRKAEELIVQGKVKVNGRVVTELGTKVDPQKDKVEVSGKLIKSQEEKVYIMLHKPVGVECTCRNRGKRGRRREEKGGRTILDLVDIPERVFPAGRLDKDSSGLLILTNDGNFANKMMHPSFEHEKEYIIDIEKPLDSGGLQRLKEGAWILGKKTSPAKVKVISSLKISITIHEGFNRQIRRMLEAVGNKVINLKRVRVGNIRLGSLAIGEWKKFKPSL